MLHAFMLAEGDKRGIFANGDQHVLEAFQILCALEGFATGLLKPHAGIFVQRLKKTRRLSGGILRVQEAGTGDVWCPTTAYGTWVMRQAGRVMITGNTKAKRRVTLSICGLGWLDESEVDAVPVARRARVTEAGEVQPEDPQREKLTRRWHALRREADVLGVAYEPLPIDASRDEIIARGKALRARVDEVKRSRRA